jgi:hypothetical protein
MTTSDLLAKIMNSPHTDEVKAHPELTQFLGENRFPTVGSLPAGSLLSGTIYFVQVIFTYVSNNNNDMRTIINNATGAIIPISKYASK